MEDFLAGFTFGRGNDPLGILNGTWFVEAPVCTWPVPIDLAKLSIEFFSG